MSSQQIAVLALAIVILVALWAIAWLVWQPVKQLSTIELQVQEFNRQVGDWEHARRNSNE